MYIYIYTFIKFRIQGHANLVIHMQNTSLPIFLNLNFVHFRLLIDAVDFSMRFVSL